MKSGKRDLRLPLMLFVPLTGVFLTTMPGRLIAESDPSLLSQPIEFNPPPLPDNQRPDGRSRGGASRDGACSIPEGQPPLTALVPPYPNTRASTEQGNTDTAPENTSAEWVFSLTTQAYPSFWFYIPYELDESRPITFVLNDENQETVYQTTLNIDTAEPGIIQISISNAEPALEVDRFYQWFFVVSCDLENFDTVQGWIERTELDQEMQFQMATLSPRSQALLLAERGLWQDALTLLGNQHQENTQRTQAQQDWRDLLESAGLNDIAASAILNCCNENIE